VEFRNSRLWTWETGFIGLERVHFPCPQAGLTESPSTRSSKWNFSSPTFGITLDAVFEMEFRKSRLWTWETGFVGLERVHFPRPAAGLTESPSTRSSKWNSSSPACGITLDAVFEMEFHKSRLWTWEMGFVGLERVRISHVRKRDLRNHSRLGLRGGIPQA